MRPLGEFALVLQFTQYILYIFPKTIYNKTIIGWGFCDIRNNQGRGKCNQPSPKAADYTCLDLDYSGYHKNPIQLLFKIITLSKFLSLIQLG